MDELTARLEALVRRYAAAYDHRQASAAELGEQFRRDLELLVAKYGLPAMTRAVNELPGGAWASVSLH